MLSALKVIIRINSFSFNNNEIYSKRKTINLRNPGFINKVSLETYFSNNNYKMII